LGYRQPVQSGIKDVDLIYFDAEDLSAKAETDHESRLRDLFRRLPIKLDVKNEARVHLWYRERFGYAIRPYLSSADAIATFPTTATAVGIRRNTRRIRMLRTLRPRRSVRPRCQTEQTADHPRHLRGESRALALYSAVFNHRAMGGDSPICDYLIILA
jgi:hypothetical protein